MHNSIEMKETLRFLHDLSLNNNKQWFDANRDRYLAARATVDALAVELIDGIRSFDKSIGPMSPKDCTYRIYRDLRFCKDKTPYKRTWACISTGEERNPDTAGITSMLGPGSTATSNILKQHTETIDMEFITLSNGIKMPILGYGVFQVPPQEAERCVADALSVGYRLIDTAQAYFNEEGVGDAIAKSGIPREEIFLVTKVWISNNGEAKAAASIDESLRKLKTDYIDLLLIHHAYGDVFGTWRAMEKAYRDGKVRAIGVSNFQAGRFFDLAHYVDIKPMVNQLQCNVMVQQTGIEPVLAEFGTKMMAWGPLGGQGVDGIVKNEKLAAIGAKYGKSAAQVALRWLTQRGIVAIPKSSHKERMEQNLNVLDYTLTAEEMAAIAGLNEHDNGLVNFGDPQFVKYLIENYG